MSKQQLESAIELARHKHRRSLKEVHQDRADDRAGEKDIARLTRPLPPALKTILG
jgi:hypothetical protein